MKEEIESQLACLIGEPLSDMWRYAGCQRFEFGHQVPTTNRKGEAITLAEYALVASCYWEADGPEGIIVSRDNFGPGDIRRDEDAKWFYQLLSTEKIIVEKIRFEIDFGLSILLSDNYSLSFTNEFPRKQRFSDWQLRVRKRMLADRELWRFFRQKGDEPHLVVTSHGIEE